MNTRNQKDDPASAWVRRTPKQRSQAAARYDREAREIVRAAKAEADKHAREAALTRSRQHVELIGPMLLRGAKRNGTPLTSEQIRGGREMLDLAWKHLLRAGVIEALP